MLKSIIFSTFVLMAISGCLPSGLQLPSEQFESEPVLENNCQTHYLNHPGYDKTILAKGVHENGELDYELRINSKTRNVDLVPVRIEKNGEWTYVFVLGIYRCEGLEELIEEFSLMEP